MNITSLSVAKVSPRRLVVWQAFSILFLDTELQDFMLHSVARDCVYSGYSDNELEYMLFEEVYPALKTNLNGTFGVWGGWSADEVRELVVGYQQWPLLKLRRWFGRLWPGYFLLPEIKNDWRKVQSFMAFYRGVS